MLHRVDIGAARYPSTTRRDVLCETATALPKSLGKCHIKIASLLYLLRFERVDKLGSLTHPLESPRGCRTVSGPPESIRDLDDMYSRLISIVLSQMCTANLLVRGKLTHCAHLRRLLEPRQSSRTGPSPASDAAYWSHQVKVLVFPQ